MQKLISTTEKSTKAAISSIEEIIDDARLGKMFILVDDEDRENEGDLIVPAEALKPEHIAFMAREGRGLICLALDGSMIDALQLPLMGHQTNFQTAFTVSIEAREGITTGISAADRTATIKAALTGNPEKISTPGHVFPLRAKDNGVLERPGHTEAAVDIARLADMKPAGVICEIMNDDGTMARLPELLVYARKHGLKIGSIADLINYRSSKKLQNLRVSI